MHRTLLRLAIIFVFAVIGIGAWSVGSGRIAYEVTHGVSMQPTYHTGDLVIVARQSSYHTGEIIAYHGGQGGHTVVLHRIIGGGSLSGFVTKGDNNQSVDPGHPTSNEVIGRAILHIPKVGAALTSPIAGGLILVVVLAALAASIRRRGHPAPAVLQTPCLQIAKDGAPRTLPSVLNMLAVLDVLAVIDLLLVIAVVLSYVLAGHRPSPSTQAVTQTGVLTYQASVPISDTYPTGRIETGDPVFLKLLNVIDVSFHYTTAPAATVKGTAQLDAVVSDTSGWHTDLSLVTPMPLAAGSGNFVAPLNLARIQALAGRVAQATGIPAGTVQVTVIASTSTSINGAKPVTYRSHLPFLVTPLELTLSGPPPSPTTYGPAITATTTLSPSNSPSRTSNGPRQLQLALLAALLLSLGGTVVAWPTATRAREDNGPLHVASPGAALKGNHRP